ncbi:MAG: alpha-amylase family glycosyl hydrolase [bacterium]|nr:alpha-amylase family glycosyl hydrolase [bacterium]
MDEKVQGFHVSRVSREKYQFETDQFNFYGKANIPNFQSARRFATRMNQRRDIGNFPNQSISPSQVNAVALIQGITQYVFRLYCARNPQLLSTALSRLGANFGDDLPKTMHKFLEEFPPQPIFARNVALPEYLNGEYEARPNKETALEELILLWLSNQNPAFSPFTEIFGDDALKQQTAYIRLTADVNQFFAGVAATDDGDGRFPAGMSIIDLLLEPVRLAPYSLDAQLRLLIERWNAVIGDYIYRLLTAMDILAEDGRTAPGAFVTGVKGETPVVSFDNTLYEVENFTADKEWMPNLVMIAKNAYVWLDQLSKEYNKPITTLDQVPDAELDKLSRWGITGLWLIGLWERSIASKTVKNLCGNPDAVASAYSLRDYRIADNLGGQPAIENLRHRAWERGIRLASDMVPNHMGIDSDWVVNHPDWFLSLDYLPYPNYTFNGVNLSNDGRVGIYLEDHYYDRTDAAVVFKRVDHHTGAVKYVYHGNDGTSMPWNDTAQLNYLNPQVREAMISTIINIAKQFPIIRFDAAMTLVKKHIQRLWFPEPGVGGAIPSRSEHAITRAQLDSIMPEEFWREVVDRAAIEAPDTLLLAEAFWLLEGYFVRTLGMHRVYNSAYMNMLRDEENAKYRSVMKNTLEFDPEILRRYVNFLNNPDEKTAVEQFGKGDKYFGVTLLMLTLPGLPMLGHGQIEGYAEKYGMEYYRAYWDEKPDQYLIERHEREVFPVVKKRYVFAGIPNFLLYDFYTNEGVNENVYAHSNRAGDERGLMLFNNAYSATRGWIKLSAAYSVKTGNGDERVLVQRTIADSLGLPNDNRHYCIFKDYKTGLEYIRNAQDLVNNGFYAELDGYQYMVLMDWRIVEETATYQYARVVGYLGGRGVPSIDGAIRELMVEPVRAPFSAMVNRDFLERVWRLRYPKTITSEAETATITEFTTKLTALLEAIKAFVGTEFMGNMPIDDPNDDEWVADSPPVPKVVDIEPIVNTATSALISLLQIPAPETTALANLWEAKGESGALWGSWITTIILQAIGTPDQARSWMDEWFLNRIITNALMELGMDAGNADKAVFAIKLAVIEPAPLFDDLHSTPSDLLAYVLNDRDGQGLMGVNHFQEIVWYSGDGLDLFVLWLVGAGVMNADDEARLAREAAVASLYTMSKRADYQVEKLKTLLRKPAPKSATKPIVKK